MGVSSLDYKFYVNGENKFHFPGAKFYYKSMDGKG